MREKKSKYPVKTLCRVVEVSRSGYYAWELRKPSLHAASDLELSWRVRTVHAKARQVYGSPRVQRQLAREGVRVSRKRVARLMRLNGLYGRKKRRHKATTDSNHQDPIAPNLLNRNFVSGEPGRVMVGDTTAITTQQGWLYLAVLTDLCTRAIIGWSMGVHNDTDLVLAALRMAMRRGICQGFIHHTDRGSTYTSAAYRDAVKAGGGIASMSRKGDCYDNAVAESVFRTVKEEALGDLIPDSPEHAQTLIFSYIEGFYNSQRLHSSIGYVPPNEFDRIRREDLSKNARSAR